MFWKEKCFVTLTYDNEHLPKNRNLVKKDFQDFLKRLRKHIEPKKLKYILSGEYGPTTLRPHGHILLMGYQPSDLKFYKYNKTKDMLFTSKELSKIWKNGYVIVGLVTYESAAYVARYTYKKAFGIDKEFNIKHGRNPEFQTASRRNGIAYSAFSNPAIWEQIKRNGGIFIKTKSGTQFKKIPQYLKQKWKDLDDREEYFKKSDKRAHELKTIARARKTSKNPWQYLHDLKEELKLKFKRLDKRNNI